MIGFKVINWSEINLKTMKTTILINFSAACLAGVNAVKIQEEGSSDLSFLASPTAGSVIPGTEDKMDQGSSDLTFL